MPQVRACINCGRPAVAGRSRCTQCGGNPRPKGPRLHDAQHTHNAKAVVAQATVCARCGLPPTPTNPLEAAHIIPASQGGPNTPTNYQAEHRSHNRADGARLAAKRFQRNRFSPPR